MVEELIFNNIFDSDLNLVNENITHLETILIENNFNENSKFKKWYKDFQKIYGKPRTNLRLYIAYALIYFIGLNFVSKFIFNEEDSLFDKKRSFKRFRLIEEKLKFSFWNLEITDFNYFSPLYTLSRNEDISFFSQVIYKISDDCFHSQIKPENILDFLFQKMISPILRHSSGEFYTPPFLVKKMVNESYTFGEMVLDPCCGSGNFLLGIVKYIVSQDKDEEEKIKALSKIYGFDINPSSIYLLKLNLLFLLKENILKIKINLEVFDFLLETRRDLNHKFDVIIGNPPWYTYRDVSSLNYQKELKKLAEKLEVKPRPKNILNLEISTLFFAKASDNYLRENGKIFFVITKGVITGSHASRFRNFKGLADIKIWKFEKKIENIFNIDFICLYARKIERERVSTLFEIPAYYFVLDHEEKEIDYFSDINLRVKKQETLIPFSIEQKGKKIFIKKLITKDKKRNLLTLKESHYKSLFHKGADLNPRNLIFVKSKVLDKLQVKISPDDRIFKRAKIPWNKREFAAEIIEKKYLFKVLKSTELVKFHIYDHYSVFLPLSKYDLSYNYNNLEKDSKNFYDKINSLYLNNKKETTLNNSLMENLNRWSKLINLRQLSKIKVVYNNSGSILNSAVIQGDFLITGDLSYMGTESLIEAYYLSAILNSNILTEQIKIMKSSRHIFKLPFNIPIKYFDSGNSTHLRLAEIGKKAHEIAENAISRVLKTEGKERITKNKIQNILKDKLKPLLNSIDKLFIEDLKLT
ncbi:hypothetical protein LCGC14_1598080 [marine sediment metagenome]|uniref:site-specific DNA-methyltransferase (adenine-specific) n=1 Tax=marine sediment metagenome TaxID=412755 RepID=A0A0F9LCA5_9ZZZZ